jgi:dihydrolipoamide dehydrogenase
MLHASELARAFGEASQLGLRAQGAGVDGPAFMKRVHDVVATLAKGLAGKYKALGVQVLAGRARIIEAEKGRRGEGETSTRTPDSVPRVSPHLPLSHSPTLLAVHVELASGGEETVCAGSVIIATGSHPSRLPGLPWDSGKVWTTDQAIQADDLPQSVLILGGGIIGCEFATMYSELGIPVTVVEMLDRLAAVLDEDASKLIARSLRRRNVTVHLASRITSMTAGERAGSVSDGAAPQRAASVESNIRMDVGAADAGITATLADGKTITAARVLVAVGRRAKIDDLGLEALGVQMAGGVIAVDDHCRTSVPGVYAIGDVAHKSQYAHLAARMGVVAAENATGLDSSDDMTVIPAAVFTHPEVATVGLNEAQARQQYPNVRGASVQYQATGIGWAYNQREGLAKIIADDQSGQIYGGLVVGYHAADVIQEIALAMRHRLTVEQLANTIHAHPTFCEAVQMAARHWLDEKAKRGAK